MNEASTWREDVTAWTSWALSSLDDLADAGMRRLRKRVGLSGKPKIQPYLGFANSAAYFLHGRVLTNPPLNPDFRDDRWWQNLTNTVQRFASDEVPGVRVTASIDGMSDSVLTDHEGYFHLKLACNPAASVSPPCITWVPVRLSIKEDGVAPGDASPALSEIMQVPDNAEFGVISDVDDTIMHTSATDIATMAKLTFFGNARTRAPLAGVASLYQELQYGSSRTPLNPRNPIFYVSSSPWNLYDLLEDFLELNAIPKGPLLLRDLGFDQNKILKEGHEHKLHKIRRLLGLYDKLPFILVGDAGQQDAMLYATAAEEYGPRILAIFIREIAADHSHEHGARIAESVEKANAVGVPLHLVRTSAEAAEYAAQCGCIPRACVNIVSQATQKDEQRTRGLV